jgi:membrane protein DedA with SNARE-associated domain
MHSYTSPDQAFAWLTTYSYIALLPIAIVEGPIISVIAGFVVSLGQMNFWIAYGILVAGDIIGDILYYSLGRWGGIVLVEKYGHRFGATPERMEKVEKVFRRHAGKTLLFGKWGHALGFPIIVTAGIVHENIWEFIGFVALGTIPKSLALLLVGFYFGQSFRLIDKYFDYGVVGMIAIAILVAAAYWLVKKYTGEYFEKTDD